MEPAYFSHKFKDAGVRYDVALNIATGDIVYWGGVDILQVNIQT